MSIILPAQTFILPIVIGMVIGAAIASVFFIIFNKRRGNGNLSVKETIAAGILSNIDDFTEMFEPVYSVSLGKSNKQQEVFAEWNARVRDSAEDNGYKALFEKKFGDYASWGQGKKKFKEKKANKIFKKKAKQLVKIFFKGNILRGNSTFETGNENTAELYDFVGDGSIETDKQYEVLAPCWTYQEMTVDKGVIR